MLKSVFVLALGLFWLPLIFSAYVSWFLTHFSIVAVQTKHILK